MFPLFPFGEGQRVTAMKSPGLRLSYKIQTKSSINYTRNKAAALNMIRDFTVDKKNRFLPSHRTFIIYFITETKFPKSAVYDVICHTYLAYHNINFAK